LTDEEREGEIDMDTNTVRLICGALAVIFGVMIFMRRRGSKAE
jgi:hypothetical protein